MSAGTALSFHGAAREVTGSCFLLEAEGKRVLVDCGMFQGGPQLAKANESDFGFDPASIDFLLLTHAHLDHCGRIPLLVKRGFRGNWRASSCSIPPTCSRKMQSARPAIAVAAAAATQRLCTR